MTDIFGLQDILDGWLQTHYLVVLWSSLIIAAISASAILKTWVKDENEFYLENER